VEGLLVFIICIAIVSLVFTTFIVIYFFPETKDELDNIVWEDSENEEDNNIEDDL
jgi:hypothetical protein